MTTTRTRQFLAATGLALALGSPFAAAGRASAAAPNDTFDCSTLHSPTCDYKGDTRGDAKLVGHDWRCTTHRPTGLTTCTPVLVFCLPNTNVCTEL